MSQLELLTKHVMGAPIKAINAMASQGAKGYDEDEAKELDEEINILENYLGVPFQPIKGKVRIKVRIIETEIMIVMTEKRTEIMIRGTKR